MTETQDAEVLFEVKAGLGRILLNRPTRLNALTFPMCTAILEQVQAWSTDDAVRAVVIEGAGEKAFCAGGDVVSAYHAGKRRYEQMDTTATLTRDFFFDEYRMNHAISVFPKPYIALLDGVTMGGGAGVSAHGSHPVVTENTLWAMPECMIGLFPDVGLCHPLSHCPGQTGVWAGLTGARLKAADLVHMGLSRFHVPRASLPAVVAALEAGGEPDAVLAQHATPPEGEAVSVVHREVIDRCFAFDTVQEIRSALAAEPGPFAAEQLATLDRQSPTSMVLTLAHLRAAASLSLAEVLELDFRVVQHCMAGVDFYEGIRALLIDKDKTPHWNPTSLEEVPGDLVLRAHQPPPEGSLGLVG